MRPRIIDFLNRYFHTTAFGWIIPDPAVVYAVMLGVGIAVFIARCRKATLDSGHAAGIAIWGSVAALLGARIFYLLQHLGWVIRDPAMLLELNGATVSFGVYLGGMTGIALYCAKHKLSLMRYLDVLASMLGLGPLIGRMACFLNGDDYGRLSSLPWAVRFPHGSQPFTDQIARGLISPMADLSLPVHPAQLYGCLNGFVLFLLFSWLWRHQKGRPGILFCWFWIAYGILRFLLECFRGDEDRGWVGPLSTGQFMSLVFIVLSASGLAALRLKPSRKPPFPSANSLAR